MYKNLANALSCKNKALHLQRYPNHNLFTLRTNTYRKHQATRCETGRFFYFRKTNRLRKSAILSLSLKKYRQKTFFLQLFYNFARTKRK